MRAGFVLLGLPAPETKQHTQDIKWKRNGKRMKAAWKALHSPPWSSEGSS